uniref:Annexin n=1 Tax=Eptatretus burgeri TaxID=7764 RepID=A0A8C4R529_EPTBU
MSMVSEILKYVTMEEGQTEMTLTDYGGVNKHVVDFVATADAEAIHLAMQQKGVDSDRIVNILTDRSNGQRHHIGEAYQRSYGKDLPSALKAALSGKMETAMLGLLKTPAEFDADELKWSVKGAGTCEDTLNEILVSRSNDELKEIMKVYKSVYKTDLQKDIESDTSGQYRNMLVALIQANRDESKAVDDHKAAQDIQVLMETVSQKKPDVGKFIEVFSTRSLPHLRKVIVGYNRSSSMDMDATLQKVMTGDVRNGFKALVSYIKSPTGFFADKLYASLKDGAKERVLTRVMVTRCEVDMLDIRKEFKKRFGKSLYNYIASKTKGDYQTILLGMCGGDDV